MEDAIAYKKKTSLATGQQYMKQTMKQIGKKYVSITANGWVYM